MATTTLTSAPARGGRLEFVDLVRGLAIVGVVIYHFAWDLGFFQYVAVDVSADPAWRTFARLLAGSFLALVGVSLVLAHRSGFRRHAFVRRLAVIAGAAAAISLATWLVFPRVFVFFGILHAIALFSVLALPFLRLPVWLTVAVAVVVLLVPLWVSVPALDTRWLAWIGAVGTVPPTNDYEPLFPWFGVTLLGVALTRLALDTSVERRLAAWHPRAAPARWLTRIGRWTLVIYLAHQPLLFAVLYPVSWAFPPSPEMQRAAFVESCERSCASAGGEADICASACVCSANAFDAQELWPALRAGDPTPETRARINAITRQCYMESSPEDFEQPRP